MEPVIKVAVIGAGAAGVAAVRLLVCEDDEKNETCPPSTIAESGLDNCDVHDSDGEGVEDNDDDDVGEDGDGDGDGVDGGGTSPTPSTTTPATRFNVTVFERDDDVGGTWRYTDNVGTNDNGLPVHASMYKNLRTFLPKEILRFPDFPFPEYLPSFPTHRDVLTYLQDYVSHFGLRKHIQFQTSVEKVKPIPSGNNRFGVQWEVTTSKMTGKKDVQTQLFDAVLVCNGQFSVPRMPDDIPGLDTFAGHVIHSHDYRVPDAYSDKTVAVLGGLLSGQEISLEVSGVADKVYLCHDHPRLSTPLPSNLEQKPGIRKCIEGCQVEFRNGETKHVDAIILCTGYHHRFPFLDESIGLKVDDGRVTPLYKHFLSSSFPSLAVLSTVQYVAFFHLFYMQIKCFRAILTGQACLPSKEEMTEDEEREYQEKRREGLPHRYAHFLLGDRQFHYYDDLADLGGFPRLPKSVQTVFETNTQIRDEDFTRYRNYDYTINADDTVQVVNTEE